MTDFDTFDTTDRNRRYGLPDPFLLPPTPSQDGQTDPYPTSERAVTAMLLGSGELGKEIAIELIRLGVVVIAVDSYSPAPAMQVAQGSAVIDMSDSHQLQALIDRIRPDIIIPEVEAIATDVLSSAAREGIQVVPSASIAQTCMDRQALRVLAHEILDLPTTPYRFADSPKELQEGARQVGFPCVVKPIMSSSGHGQTVVQSEQELPQAWESAQEGRRAAREGQVSRVIVEALVPLDYELTILTVASSAGVVTCAPIGHVQKDGDYRESWQPAQVPDQVLVQGQTIAKTMVGGLVKEAAKTGERGWGLYGVELFVLTDGRVLFNEVSPRPHDTGMVTMISQRLSEFALHARAVLGVPIPEEALRLLHPCQAAASRAIVVSGEGRVSFSHLPQALSLPASDLRIFGKPEVHGHRRMGVALASADTVEQARRKTEELVGRLEITLSPADKQSDDKQ